MARQILEGLWDCPYCKSKAIGGLTKHCPCCGHPQDAGTKFYMGERKKYLDSDLAEQYGKGADWVCEYCGSLNRVHYQYCANCASPRESASKDYFTAKQDPKPQSNPKPQSAPAKVPSVKPQKKRSPMLLVIALIVLAGLLFFMWPRTYSAQVTTAEWSRQIDVEAWRTVQESDWSVPDGGRVTDSKREIHHYDDVLDHYETKTRQVSEQVYDGEDTHTSYIDNGDGTFTQETYTTPRYRTEYHTETYQSPVYRQEPVYATKYYYDIERWVPDREEKSGGADCAPYWPEVTLADNERENSRHETYTVTIETDKGKAYTVPLTLEQWETLRAGQGVSITVSGGSVTKINDMNVR